MLPSTEGPGGHVSGLDPERKSYASLATFADPDNNLWLLQEVTGGCPAASIRTRPNSTSSAELAGRAPARRRRTWRA